MSTPASVWKRFCRLAEGKRAKPFGDLAAALDRCALFEFGDEQLDAAGTHHPSPSADDDSPIPPFPFPELCVLSPWHATLLRSPVMDEDTGVLEFETMVFQILGQGPDEDIFQTATCVVESTQVDKSGAFPMTLRDVRGLWNGRYWDDQPQSYIDEDDLPVAFEVRYADHLAQLEQSRSTASPEKVIKIEKAIAKLRDVHERVEAAKADKREHVAEIQRLDAHVEEVGAEHVRSSFYLALQLVNWINHPDHFTVEAAGSSSKRRKKKARIRRLGERPRHILLTKHQIADEWHRVHHGSTHASPLPHLRRGHYKTLRSERYKEKRGQRIWVRATHVNGACVEWRDGDVTYKVL